MKILYTLAFNLIFILAYSQNKWERMNPVPLKGPGVHHPVTFSIDSFGYSVTGGMFYADSARNSNAFFKYDPSTDQWSELPDFPGIGRSYAVGLSYNGKGYVAFGLSNTVTLKDLWEYDPKTENWKRLADCPCEERIHPAFVATNGRIYVGAGGNATNLKDFWEYDIATNKWTSKPEVPGPRRHHPFYFAIDSFAYVGFGHGSDIVNNDAIYRDFHRYNTYTNKWTTLDTFPGQQRVAGTQFDSRGKGYVLSGDGVGHRTMQKGEFWEFNPLTLKWKELPPHDGTQSLWAPGSFVIGDYVYMIGGEDAIGLLNDVQRYKLHETTVNVNPAEKSNIQIQTKANQLIVNGLEVNAAYSIEIIDETGRILQSEQLVSNQINIQHLHVGSYFLLIQQNNKNSIHKFVKL